MLFLHPSRTSITISVPEKAYGYSWLPSKFLSCFDRLRNFQICIEFYLNPVTTLGCVETTPIPPSVRNFTSLLGFFLAFLKIPQTFCLRKTPLPSNLPQISLQESKVESYSLSLGYYKQRVKFVGKPGTFELFLSLFSEGLILLFIMYFFSAYRQLYKFLCFVFLPQNASLFTTVPASSAFVLLKKKVETEREGIWLKWKMFSTDVVYSPSVFPY